MKYEKCPRCDLNYKTEKSEYCTVCEREIRGEQFFEDSDMLCPMCYKSALDYDEVICKKCARRRNKNETDNE